MALQLEFFKTPEQVELDDLRKKVCEAQRSLEKVRKGTYASIAEIKRLCDELSVRQAIIERNICQK